jgi:hypothetical protein
MDQAFGDQLAAEDAANEATQRLAAIEAVIAKHGLRPDSAAELWRAREAVAETQSHVDYVTKRLKANGFNSN